MQRKRTSPIWQVPTERFKEVISKYETYTDILNYFGLKNHGSNYRTLNERIEHEGINIEHIHKAREERRLKPLFSNHEKTKILSEVLVKNSKYNRGRLKERLIREGLLEEKCNDCGLGTTWNGKPITLHLEHKNGVNDDNRLENLCLLCPNCHSQTDTYAGKATKGLKRITHRCLKCKNARSSKSKSGMCRKCFHEEREGNIVAQKTIFETEEQTKTLLESGFIFCKGCSNVITPSAHSGYCTSCFNKTFTSRKVQNRPTRLELLDLILHKPFVQIGKDYNVSDTAVRKWCKSYGLPHLASDIKVQKEQLLKELEQATTPV